MGQPALLRHCGSTTLSSHLLACGTCWLQRGARTQLRAVLGLRFAHHTCSLSRGALASAIRDAGRPLPAWPHPHNFRKSQQFTALHATWHMLSGRLPSPPEARQPLSKSGSSRMLKKFRQRRSRVAQRLNVRHRVRLASSLAAALLDILFEHAATRCIAVRDLYTCARPGAVRSSLSATCSLRFR